MDSDITIMLVDNDDTDNLISGKIIEHSQLCDRVTVFTSGRQALQFLEEHAGDASQLPDLIFLDMNMPVMNGSLFLTELEKVSCRLLKNPKVVILSSYDKATTEVKFTDSKWVVKYLNKPLNENALADVVKEFSRNGLKVA